MDGGSWDHESSTGRAWRKVVNYRFQKGTYAPLDPTRLNLTELFPEINFIKEFFNNKG